MPMGVAAAPRPLRATATLWRTVKSPMMATVGRASPSGTSDNSSHDGPPRVPQLCSPGCPSEAGQTPEAGQRWFDSRQVHSLSSLCHSPFLLVLLLFLLRAALCILKTSHPGCNVNNAEGRPSCWAEAGVWAGSVPYTSVAMTHSFLSSDIKHTDWYTESLGEHIADIRHSGFSLCNRSGTFSPKLLSL